MMLFVPLKISKMLLLHVGLIEKLIHNLLTLMS